MVVKCAALFLVVAAGLTAATTRVCIGPDLQYENGGNGHVAHWQNNMVPWAKAIQPDGKPRCEVVLMSGDWTDLGITVEYDALTASVNELIAAGVKVISVVGNHDHYDGASGMNCTQYSTWIQQVIRPGGTPLPYLISTAPSYGTISSYAGCADMNAAYDLSIGGVPTLVLTLQWLGGGESWYYSVDAWATGVINTWLAAHPTGQIWYGMHVFGKFDTPTTGDVLDTGTGADRYWTIIRTKPKANFIWSGHWDSANNHAGLVTQVNDSGKPVPALRVDYQYYGGNGAGIMYYFDVTGRNFTGYAYDTINNRPDTDDTDLSTVSFTLAGGVPRGLFPLPSAVGK